LNTVTVKTRIDGELLKIQYQEGELVHQGDVLIGNRSASLSGPADAGAGATGERPGGAGQLRASI